LSSSHSVVGIVGHNNGNLLTSKCRTDKRASANSDTIPVSLQGNYNWFTKEGTLDASCHITGAPMRTHYKCIHIHHKSIYASTTYATNDYGIPLDAEFINSIAERLSYNPMLATRANREW
jgi:hypothetical protein